jgi:hypothetical protein
MAKKLVPKHSVKGIPKDEQTMLIREKHFITGLVRGYSFSHHSHGRVNHHSIGFNHEPGTM